MYDLDLSRTRWGTWLLIATLAVYLVAVRLWGVSDSFLMLRDQIRDWRFALGPLSDLPLTGTQSTAGGSSLGPIYYWLLWLVRHLVGPFTGYRPHAGAIGLAGFQTLADLAFFYAIARHTGSRWLALATTLIVATTAHDLAISSTIWNPSVSVAFVKFAVAGVLLEPPVPTMLRTIGVTTAAWFAVQAHSAALFVAAPLVGAHVLRELAAGRIGPAWQRTRTILETILVLQLPFLYFAFTNASEAGPARALAGANAGLRVRESTEAVLQLSTRILTAPWPATGWTALLVGCVLVLAFRARRDLRLLSVTVLPLAVTALGFSIWQGGYDEYWYLPLVPCTALTVSVALTTWRMPQASIALLIAVLIVQPWRVQASRVIYRMPEYGALSRGAATIYRQTKVIRSITTTFPTPALSDSGFIYEAMGGTFDDTAPFAAVIGDSGQVRFVSQHVR